MGHVKKHIPLLLLLIGIYSPYLMSEVLLKVRPKEGLKERPQAPLTRSDDETPEYFKPSSFRLTNVQFQIITPLIQETFPEKRFRAWGNSLSASFYITQLGEKAYFHLEPGVGVTLIRLSLSQPAVDFSHLFVLFPVRGRLIYEIGQKFFAEAFVGMVLRPWEYDSREGPDGGFHRTVNDFITIDGGFGVGGFINENLFGRLSLGVQLLSFGFGIVL